MRSAVDDSRFAIDSGNTPAAFAPIHPKLMAHRFALYQQLFDEPHLPFIDRYLCRVGLYTAPSSHAIASESRLKVFARCQNLRRRRASADVSIIARMRSDQIKRGGFCFTLDLVS
jgi:hypothetical protein